MLIGDPDDAVVFDFKPGIDAGAENLARRGEDQRFDEQRPAARRRRAIQEALADGPRAEGETRADGRSGRAGPATMRAEVTGARRIVVKVGSSSLTTAAGGIDPDPGQRAGRRARRGPRPRHRGGAGLLRRDRGRAGAARA